MLKSHKKFFITVGVVGATVLLWISVEITADMCGIMLPWHKSSAIAATLEWGGLASLPHDIKDLEVTTEGNSFTRTFIVKFTAPKHQIESWRKRSRRLADNKPETISDSLLRYNISPGENGSIGGWVEIENKLWQVKIKMSWS